MGFFKVIFLVFGLCVLNTESLPAVDRHHASAPQKSDEILNLPFYGGAKGQYLQIRQKPDGSIEREVVRGSQVDPKESFHYNLYEIQKAASELVGLQEQVKKTGVLTPEGQKTYASNLEKLGISAQKLAHIQKDTSVDDFRMLFEEAGPYVSDRVKETILRADSISQAKLPSDIHNYGISDKDTTIPELATKKPHAAGDSIGINSPDEEASIAEAKPVGLAIAGIGGVASSRPVATAIVGDGGLAVANPVATAIAGLSIEEVSDLGIPIRKKLDSNQAMFKMGLPLKGKYGLAETSINAGVGVLVGPGFRADMRLSDIEIQDQLENKLAGLNVPSDIVERTLLGENENGERKDPISTDKDSNNDDAIDSSTSIPLTTQVPPTTTTTTESYKMMAVAPNEIVPNQYPLIPPPFNSYSLESLKTPWINEQQLPYQFPGYETGPFDQYIVQERGNPAYPQMTPYNQVPQQQISFYNPFTAQMTPTYNPFNYFLNYNY
jgi:hypothetical protein